MASLRRGGLPPGLGRRAVLAKALVPGRAVVKFDSGAVADASQRRVAVVEETRGAVRCEPLVGYPPGRGQADLDISPLKKERP